MSNLNYTDVINTSSVSNSETKTKIESVLDQIDDTNEGQVLLQNILQGEMYDIFDL